MAGQVQVGVPEAVQGVGLAAAIVLQVLAGAVVVAEIRARPGEVAVGTGLRRPVGQPVRGVETGALGGHQIVPVAAPFEVHLDGGGELPDVRVEAVPGGQRDDTEQNRVLAGEPVQRLCVGADRGEGHPA